MNRSTVALVLSIQSRSSFRTFFCPFWLVIPCVFYLFLPAFVNAAENDVRYTAEMTRLPAGADVAAMGDAGVALPGRASSSIWNPALAAYVNQYVVSAEGADLYQHLSQHGCFSGSAPLRSNSGVAVHYQPFYSGVIEEYDTIPEASGFNGLTRYKPQGYFKNYQHLITVGVARKVSTSMPRFSETAFKMPFEIAFGGNLKAFIQYMNPGGDRYMGLGYSMDVGMSSRIGLDYDIDKKEISREIQVGVSVRDVLPTDIVWIYSNDDVWMYSPTAYREAFTYAHYYGVSYTDRSSDLPFDWTLALSLHKEYEVTYHGGLELLFMKKVLFRAGLSDKTPVFGTGLRYKNMFVDYAFRFDAVAISYARLTAGVMLPRHLGSGE